jgi:hypothetical protein
MTRRKRAVRTLLLVMLLSAAMIMQVELVPTSGFRVDRHADQPQGIAVLAGVSDDDEGPPPCTVASPCESGPLSAFAAGEDTPYTMDSLLH